MDSQLDEKPAEGQLESFEEQLSNLAREAEVTASDPPVGMKTFSPSPAIHRLADWRSRALVGSLLAASIGVAAWWLPSVHTETTAPTHPAPLTVDAPIAVTLSSDLAQQLQPIAHDLAALRQAVAQLEITQGQLVRDNENVANQLKASQAEMARNSIIIEQIKATQVQVERENETVTERLNESQKQLARVIAVASEAKAIPEDPKVSPEEAKVTPEIPVPRPRRPTNVVQTHKPAPTPIRPQAQANEPQPSSRWPWPVR